VTAVDIVIRAEAGVKISGRVLNPFVLPTGAPPVPTILDVLSRDPNALAEPTPSFRNTSPNRTNGEFEIRNVRPGSYDLISISGVNGVAFGRAHVEVGNRDLEGVSIAIRSGAEVRARMSVDGAPPASNVWPEPRFDLLQLTRLQPAVGPDGATRTVTRSTIQLQLRSKEGHWRFDSAVYLSAFDPSGLFVFRGVAESRYNLQVSGLPANAYVEDIREGGVSIYDDGISIAGGAVGPIDVIINTKGATVKGTVVDAKQQPFASARIVLVPKQTRRQNAALYRTTTSDTIGNFTVNGIAPGEYKVFAWESVPDNAWLNADFLAEFEQRGTSITVSPGAPVSVEVTLIPNGARNGR
jgi:hypothetical protein